MIPLALTQPPGTAPRLPTVGAPAATSNSVRDRAPSHWRFVAVAASPPKRRFTVVQRHAALPSPRHHRTTAPETGGYRGKTTAKRPNGRVATVRPKRHSGAGRSPCRRVTREEAAPAGRTPCAQHTTLPAGSLTLMAKRSRQARIPDTRRFSTRKVLTEEDAEHFVVAVLTAYRVHSIREIAAGTGRSYGSVHRVLAAAGVLRQRGTAGRPPADSP
ncbi:helix-turn-helix domain-containing protein [Streptomyces sp. NPDC055078]